MKRPRAMGKRLTPAQAAIDTARRIKDATKPRRFAGKVSNVTNRETTGTVECTGPISEYAITVQVRANVDLAANDYIWIREDQGAQGTFVFDGFVKGGGTGNNAANAAIPWTQTPGVTSPAGSDLSVTAPAGQTTNIGSSGDPVTIVGDISGVELNDLDDVNAAAPSDNDALTWDTATSKWINEALSAGWPYTGKYLSVDTADADAEYATIAAAIAAASAGDTILLSSESIGCANQTLPDGVHLGCLGPSAAILTNSSAAVTLNVGNGSVVFNIEVRNTYASAAVYAVYMPTNTDTARFYNVTANPDNSGGTGNAYAFYVGGSSELINCRGITDAAGYGYGFVGIGTGDKKIQGGRFDGTGVSGGDDVNNQAGTTTLNSPTLVNSKLDTLLAASGTRGNWQTAAGMRISDDQRITNTSGGTVSAGAVGYLDEAGEFKTTTTAYLDAAWCVVLVGGANNANVYVTRRGRATVTLNGNCSAGDYLYTSTTAGQAQPQSYTRPELFGVALTANAGGAGGTCTAVLLCNTRYVNVQSATDVFSVASAASSDFRATINGAPVGASVVYNAPISGAENTIDPIAADQFGKIRLYNETRGDYALIDDVNTGTNTITLTANAPAGWVNGDTITTRSQTCVYGAPPPYFYDIDLSSADNTTIPIMARTLELDISVLEAVLGYYAFTHPWDTLATSKIQAVYILSTVNYIPRSVSLPLIQRRFCIWWLASGAATFHVYCRLKGYWVAEP